MARGGRPAYTAPAMPTDTPPAPGHGYPLSEAARRLGIPREALRARVRRGQVAATKLGGTWVVYLPTDIGQGAATDPVTDPATAAGSDQGVLIAELRDQVRWLRERVEYFERLTEHQAGQLAEAQRQLPPPVGGPDDHQEQQEPPTGVGPSAPEPVTTPPVRRPWWRRWFGG
jgi:hypothetical protein